MEDFINSQITQITFPGTSASTAGQNIQGYPIQKRPGYELDQLMQKTITLSMKNTESYIAYFVMRQ